MPDRPVEITVSGSVMRIVPRVDYPLDGRPFSSVDIWIHTSDRVAREQIAAEFERAAAELRK